MKIGEILREKQPKEYKKLRNEQNTIKKHEHFSTREIEELMYHSCYKRSKGGGFEADKINGYEVNCS